MSECVKTSWGVTGWLLLIMVVMANSQHIEYYDSGEKSDYFNQLDYPINVDLPLYGTTNAVSEEGDVTDKYNVMSSGSSRPRIAYRLDFIAEEPVKRKSLADNLFTTIDRMASFHTRNTKSHSSFGLVPACHCKMDLKTRLPFYRYAYSIKVPPCHRRHYKRIARAQSATNAPLNAVDKVFAVMSSNSRRKRDVYANGILRRSNTKQKVKRYPLRFVKMYRKKLPQRRREPFKRFVNNMREQVKRFQQKPKPSFTFKRPKLVKRDIRAEYDLMEKRKEQMDLTLPEIIQFMPETLQPEFRRGQCNIGCAAIRKSWLQDSTDVSPLDAKDEKQSDRKNIVDDEETYKNNEHKAQLHFYLIPPPQNAINRGTVYSYTDTYQSDVLQKDANMPELPRTLSFNDDDAYRLQQRSQRQINNNQAEAPLFFFDNQQDQSITESNQWVNNQFQHHQNELSLMNPPRSGILQHSPADMAAPQFLGDLYSPEILQKHGNAQSTSISKEVLDKIVADIVNRHPGFIEAAAHHGGALVDPELIQIADTKDLIHKLIAGRLGLWFGN